MTKSFQLENFLPYRLNILAQEVSEQLSKIYATRFSLDIPQWRILANLAARGDMTAQSIAEITHSHKSTISRAVAALEQRKLIARVASPDDKRAMVLRPTAKGKELFSQILPLVLSFESNLMDEMSSSERQGVLEALRILERVVIGTRQQLE